MRLDALGLANVMANDVKSLPSPTLSEAMHLYLHLKGVGKAKTFHQAAMGNVGVVVQVVGDKPIAEYSTIDASKVRAPVSNSVWLIKMVASFFIHLFETPTTHNLYTPYGHAWGNNLFAILRSDFAAS